MTPTDTRVAVACGGTGGHVFPGLATGMALRRKGVETALILSGRDVEAPMVEDWPGVIITVRCSQPRWRSPAGFIKSVCGLAGAYLRARRELRSFKPHALLAMGSYTSFGPVLAARSLGIPVVLHDANVIPGTAVTRLSPMAAHVATSFADTARHLPPSASIINTGLPIRTELAEARPLDGYEEGPFTVLVMGGSQGSLGVNKLAAEALLKVARRISETPRVIHLAGKSGAAETRAIYDRGGLKAEVLDFLGDMGGAYAAADLCISRSGAAACFELCLCGLPSILIPLPNSARNHQQANAAALADRGAAIMTPQNKLSAESLAELITTLRADPDRLADMRGAARKMARPRAADDLADLVIRTASERRSR